MNVSHTGLCQDDRFGPTIDGCRYGFDFTLLFEESFFTILPAAIFLCVSPLRVASIWRRPKAIASFRLGIIKLLLVVVLLALKITLLVLYALPFYNHGFSTRTTVAAATLDVVAILGIGTLSALEHNRSLRPSAIIGVFLFFTTLLDAARLRSDWLIADSSSIARLALASFILKLFLLVAEATHKKPRSPLRHSPEVTSGIYSLSLLAWLNPLIWRAYKADLILRDLFNLPDQITSRVVAASFNGLWSSGKTLSDQLRGDNALAWIIVRNMWPSIALTMVPRLAFVGFSIAQPFLVEAAIEFDSDLTRPRMYGQGLFGAFVLTYFGIAVSTAWYQYLTTQVLSKIRAALINAIYETTLMSATEAKSASSPASLMGADVERVMTRLRYVISTAANVVK